MTHDQISYAWALYSGLRQGIGCRTGGPGTGRTEGGGGRRGQTYQLLFTTGDTDFLLITEAEDAESVIAGLLAVEAAGMICDVTTSRAWTGSEFKAVADKASRVASQYRPLARAD